MDELMALWTKHGLISEGLGPRIEWAPSHPAVHQRMMSSFWRVLEPMLSDQYGDDDEATDDDLPEWMSERAVDLLKANE